MPTKIILFAQAETQQLDISPLPTIGGGDQAQTLWERALPIVFGIVAAMALLLVVINGFQYITSAGDPQKANKARMGLLYSALGLLVALFAVAIVTFVIKGVG